MQPLSRQGIDGLREALYELPLLSAHSAGREVVPEQIYFPVSHAETLNPQVTLIVGNRGMGKSFWASALAHETTRNRVLKAYAHFLPKQIEEVDVHFGFADAEGGYGAISRDQISSVAQTVAPEIIWRATIIRHLAPLVGATIPTSFAELARWVRDEIELQQAIFREADAMLAQSGKRYLFLFDQLDQLADDWMEIQRLTRGLLRVALALKSYRSLSAKIFMRPDQAENHELFRFPDASKIYGNRVRLRWRAVELYGLLFFELSKRDGARSAIEEACQIAGVDYRTKHKQLRSLPAKLVWDASAQHKIFDLIAGQYMGQSAKRGLPYTWVPVHLADAKGEVSPRTFLQAARVAVDHLPPPTSTPIDHEGLLEGVREASDTRLVELREDYPWVEDALEPLRGLLVPCEPWELSERWAENRTTAKIVQKYKHTSAPLGLMGHADLFGERDENYALIASLSEIGVLEVRANGKINVPDIFRIKAGILRKGGVTPQQRKTL